MTIGRIRSKVGGLVINESRLSKIHCKLSWVIDKEKDRRYLWIEDKSQFGTWVNGAKMEKSVQKKLQDADIVTVLQAANGDKIEYTVLFSSVVPTEYEATVAPH